MTATGRATRARGPPSRSGASTSFDKAECVHCHAGRDATPGLPHNTATTLFHPDVGRAGFTEEDVGRCVPTALRNVAPTAPHLRDGRGRSRRARVETDNGGGAPYPIADALIRALGPTPAEIDGLSASLNTPTDPTVATNPKFGPGAA